MEQTVALMIMALMLGASQPVKAQEGISEVPAQQQEIQKPLSPEERFSQCIDNDDCSMQERMRIMSDMNDDMRETIGQMDRNCMMMNYNECIGPQRDEREQWHKMHSYMRDMMQSMEMRSLEQERSASSSLEKEQDSGEIMNKREPSSGEEKSQEKKRFPWWPEGR